MQGQLDSGELIAEAEQQFAAGDFSTAIINLKNVVSRDKTDARARFLLGRAYIESGNPAAALKELGKARELGERDQELDLGIVRARFPIPDNRTPRVNNSNRSCRSTGNFPFEKKLNHCLLESTMSEC